MQRSCERLLVLLLQSGVLALEAGCPRTACAAAAAGRARSCCCAGETARRLGGPRRLRRRHELVLCGGCRLQKQKCSCRGTQPDVSTMHWLPAAGSLVLQPSIMVCKSECCSNPQPCHCLTIAAAAHHKLRVLLQQCLVCRRPVPPLPQEGCCSPHSFAQQANMCTLVVTMAPSPRHCPT